MGFTEKKTRLCNVLYMILFCIVVMAAGRHVSAATATVSASSVSAVKGDTVTVTVSVTSSDTIGGADVFITYDTSILEFVSGTDVRNEGSGSLYWLAFDMSSSVNELSVTLTFKALAAGTSTIGISSSTEVYDENADNITYTSSNGKVTVTTPSTDATLSALKVTGTTDSGSSSTITLSPSFSKNTTSYTATVENNITKAVTTATANNSKATVSISDASLSLKTGTNTVTVKVTAESGATKTYTITITRKKSEATTTQKTTTEETTTEETTTEETTPEETTEEETTTAAEQILVMVDGQTRILLAEFDESLLPEGFEMTEITWEDEVIAAGQGIYKELTLVCTADEAGENPQLYILQADGSLLVLRNYQTKAVLYTILELPDAEAPEGFQSATLVMETDHASEDEIEAWQSLTSPEYYLVYAMNWDGESGYYLYDSAENTFQRYAAAVSGGTTEPSVEETTGAEEDSDAVATPANATPTDGGTADDSPSGIWKYIVMLLEAAVIVILAVLLILSKRRGGGPDGGDMSAEDVGEDAPSGTESDEENKTQPGMDIRGSFPDEEAWSGGKYDGEQPDKDPEGYETRSGMENDRDGFGGTLYGSSEESEAPDEEDFDEDTMSLQDYFSEFDAMLDELDDSMKK